MKWSLQQLQKTNGRPFDFSGTYDFKEEIKDIDDILDISTAEVNGRGKNIYQDRYEFDIDIRVTLILEDARTLEPVQYPLELKVTEIFDVDANEDEDVRIIEKNTIDLKDVVWENILLEKPIRFIKDETQTLE